MIQTCIYCVVTCTCTKSPQWDLVMTPLSWSWRCCGCNNSIFLCHCTDGVLLRGLEKVARKWDQQFLSTEPVTKVATVVTVKFDWNNKLPSKKQLNPSSITASPPVPHPHPRRGGGGEDGESPPFYGHSARFKLGLYLGAALSCQTRTTYFILGTTIIIAIFQNVQTTPN